MDGNVKKRKKYAAIEAAEPEASPEQEQPKVPFEIWFKHMLTAKRVKFWQEEPLLVFMQKQGLSKSEAEDTYTKALERF